MEIPVHILQVLTTQQAWHYGVVPYAEDQGKVQLYADLSRSLEGIAEELELLLGKEIELEKVEKEQLQALLGRYYRKPLAAATSLSKGYNKADFLDNLLQEAKDLGSSDIHFEAYEANCRVRFRIDGLLIERYQLKKEEYPGLINKIKIKAKLDIAEKRLPQDGRIFYKSGAEKIDIRVSTMPTLYGEKAVLRLLGGNATQVDIEKLGLSKVEKDRYLQGVRRPNGIILISGPTGSGKTTTLYSTLKILNENSRNIVTIEDPIEYTLEGINQVQLKENIGLDFASAIKTFMRQDPDVIMLGEIRDLATAQMAIRASLTGHLVLSTIHTNSAWGIIPRLIDMGVPNYLLADTLNLAVAQRLVRLLCPHCKSYMPCDHAVFPPYFKPPVKLEKLAKANGCEACHYSGYKGRMGVFEIIPIDDVFSEQIRKNNLSIQTLLEERSIRTLSNNAFELLKTGQTSIKEVYALL
ncbi:MAG: GspE/PulE family protein [Bacteroidota bacterium]